MALIYPDANDPTGIIKRAPATRSTAGSVAGDMPDLHHSEHEVRASQLRARRRSPRPNCYRRTTL